MSSIPVGDAIGPRRTADNISGEESLAVIVTWNPPRTHALSHGILWHSSCDQRCTMEPQCEVECCAQLGDRIQSSMKLHDVSICSVAGKVTMHCMSPSSVSCVIAKRSLCWRFHHSLLSGMSAGWAIPYSRLIGSSSVAADAPFRPASLRRLFLKYNSV